jgi:hypothetical protein
LKSSKTANANILVQKGVHGWPVWLCTLIKQMFNYLCLIWAAVSGLDFDHLSGLEWPILKTFFRSRNSAKQFNHLPRLCVRY